MSQQRAKLSRDRKGNIGTVVTKVHAKNGWEGHIAFRTHGLTKDEAVAEHDRLVARHERKADKLSSLAMLIGRRLGDDFVITDATVRDLGDEACELICIARSGKQRVLLQKYFADPSDVPDAESVAFRIARMVDSYTASHAEAEARAVEIRRAIGMEGVPE